MNAWMVVATLTLLAQPGPGATMNGPESVARAFWGHLAAGRFAEAEAMYDARMRAALPRDKLAETWRMVEQQAGKAGNCSTARTETAGAFHVVVLECRFAATALDVKVTLDADSRVSGLFFLPPRPAWSAPPYVDAARFRDVDATVRTGRWALPATLTLPSAQGRVPAVVLVHGSGPNDRDESVGALKPFKDLAWGLGSRGIAVVRYEKRTRVYGADISDTGRYTVQDEILDDVVSAFAWVRARPEVDPARVFVMGHSLGGTLIPRLAARLPAAAGFVSLAPTARALEDVMVEQAGYLAADAGEDGNKHIEMVKAAAVRIKALTARDATGTDAILGAPPSYWLDLRAHDPVAGASAVDKPWLILHGARDYQVTQMDFDRWKVALARHPRASLRQFPALNHLFVAGQGRSTPAEYAAPGHVSTDVVDAVAGFVTAPRR